MGAAAAGWAELASGVASPPATCGPADESLALLVPLSLRPRLSVTLPGLSSQRLLGSGSWPLLPRASVSTPLLCVCSACLCSRLRLSLQGFPLHWTPGCCAAVSPGPLLSTAGGGSPSWSPGPRPRPAPAAAPRPLWCSAWVSRATTALGWQPGGREGGHQALRGACFSLRGLCLEVRSAACHRSSEVWGLASRPVAHLEFALAEAVRPGSGLNSVCVGVELFLFGLICPSSVAFSHGSGTYLVRQLKRLTFLVLI